MNELEATRAKLKCLEMVEGTDLKWWEVAKHRGEVCSSWIDFSHHRDDYEFALGVVEGKPVWEGDKLWINGEYITPNPTCAFKYYPWSWNPPKPKTVMVELSVDDAQCIESAYRGMNGFAHGKLSEACRKALEKLNDANP